MIDWSGKFKSCFRCLLLFFGFFFFFAQSVLSPASCSLCFVVVVVELIWLGYNHLLLLTAYKKKERRAWNCFQTGSGKLFFSSSFTSAFVLSVIVGWLLVVLMEDRFCAIIWTAQKLVDWRYLYNSAR